MLNRPRLIDLLARLVSDGRLTEDQAHDIIDRYDAGSIRDLQFPITPDEFVEGLADDDDTEQWLAALLLLIGSQTIALSIRQRIKRVDTVQDTFASEARAHASRLAQGKLTIAEWQRRLFASYKERTIQQALLGAGDEDLSAEQRKRLDGKIRTDAAYLSRFADQAALHRLIDEELSEAYIANRSEAYGGTGRGEFFESLSGAVLLLGGGNGWVERYIAVDDRKTCFICLDAAGLRGRGTGYFLPGQGVYPGIGCLGKGRCRCVRIPEYNPAIYAQLSGL